MSRLDFRGNATRTGGDRRDVRRPRRSCRHQPRWWSTEAGCARGRASCSSRCHPPGPRRGITSRRTQRGRGSDRPACAFVLLRRRGGREEAHRLAVFASMHSQVDTLVQLGADLCFFTDHDHIIALTFDPPRGPTPPTGRAHPCRGASPSARLGSRPRSLLGRHGPHISRWRTLRRRTVTCERRWPICRSRSP